MGTETLSQIHGIQGILEWNGLAIYLANNLK